MAESEAHSIRPEQTGEELPSAAEVGVRRRNEPPASPFAMSGGIVALLIGVALIVIGTAVLTEMTAVVRIVVVVSGAVVAYRGYARIGRSIWGERFEADLWLALFWLGLVVFVAVTADALPLAEAKDVSKTLTAPILERPDLFSAHPLGTDRQGLDILGGVIHGARVSLVVSFGAVAIGMTVGGAVGLCAGYYRGKIDGLVSLIADSMLAFPPLILLLGMVTVLSPTVGNVTIALALLGIPTYIRLARANTLVFAQREFVLAAKTLGERNGTIIRRELLPNVVPPVISFGFIIVAVLIVAEASLSFLGLSIQRPTPTWGNMIAAGQSDFDRHPHLVFVPGAVLFVTVYSLNRIGDKARDLWDRDERKL